MILKNKLFAMCLLLIVAVSACKKDTQTYDKEKHLADDEITIKAFIASNNITGLTRHSSGIYYQIIAPGTGSVAINNNTTITINYEGKLLSGKSFDKTATGTPAKFTLGTLIEGWQIGVPLIQPGGKIRLIIPSAYCYQDRPAGQIPANSVLDFNIELVSATN